MERRRSRTESVLGGAAANSRAAPIGMTARQPGPRGAKRGVFWSCTVMTREERELRSAAEDLPAAPPDKGRADPALAEASRLALERYKLLLSGECSCGGWLRQVRPEDAPPLLAKRSVYKCRACHAVYNWLLYPGPQIEGE